MHCANCYLLLCLLGEEAVNGWYSEISKVDFKNVESGQHEFYFHRFWEHVRDFLTYFTVLQVNSILSHHQRFNITGWRQDGRAFSLKLNYWRISDLGPHPSLPFPSFPLHPFSFLSLPSFNLRYSLLTLIFPPFPPFHSQFPSSQLLVEGISVFWINLTFSLQKCLEMLWSWSLAVNHSSLISRSKYFQAFVQAKGQTDPKYRNSFYCRFLPLFPSSPL